MFTMCFSFVPCTHYSDQLIKIQVESGARVIHLWKTMSPLEHHFTSRMDFIVGPKIQWWKPLLSLHGIKVFKPTMPRIGNCVFHGVDTATFLWFSMFTLLFVGLTTYFSFFHPFIHFIWLMSCQLWITMCDLDILHIQRQQINLFIYSWLSPCRSLNRSTLCMC